MDWKKRRSLPLDSASDRRPMSKLAPRHYPRITDVFRHAAPSPLWLPNVERSVLCIGNAVDHNAAQRSSGVCRMTEHPEIASKKRLLAILVVELRTSTTGWAIMAILPRLPTVLYKPRPLFAPTSSL